MSVVLVSIVSIYFINNQNYLAEDQKVIQKKLEDDWAAEDDTLNIDEFDGEIHQTRGQEE